MTTFPAVESGKVVVFASSRPFLPLDPLDTWGNFRHCWYMPGKCQMSDHVGRVHDLNIFASNGGRERGVYGSPRELIDKLET